jgi:putative flippase GtrA
MIKLFFTKQFLKFLLVGGTAAGANWLARILINFWTSFFAAVALAYVVGMICAFILNRIFVFPESTRSLKLQMRDFFITNFIAFWLVLGTSLGLKSLFENMGMIFYPAEISHLIAVAVPTFVSFLIYKLFAFK